MSVFSSSLEAQPPTTITYYNTNVSGGPIIGGLLVGDFSSQVSSTPAGGALNIPSITLSSTVPVSAAVELQSTTGSLLIMRMTTTQRNALLTVVDGMMIYNSTTATFQFYQGSAWVSLSAGAGGVVGPGGGSTDNAVARWDGVGGTDLQDSSVIISDTDAITGVLSIATGLGTAGAPSYNFTGDTTTGIYSSGASAIDFAAAGVREFQVNTSGGTTVNYLSVEGSAAGAPVQINAVGTDTNIGVLVTPKGTGALENAVGAVATPSYSFTGDLDTGMWHSAANTLDFSTNALTALQLVAAPASSVNYVTVTPSIATTPVLVSAAGTDTNIGIGLITKGTGGVEGPVGAVATPGYTFTGDVNTGMWRSAADTIDFSTGALRQFQVSNTATVVDFLSVTGSATNAGDAALQPKLVASGTDTDIDVGVQGKAAGGLAILASTTGVAAKLTWWNGAGTFNTTMSAGSNSADLDLTLPIIDAVSAGAPLVSNASGVLSFQDDAILVKSSTLSSANLQAMSGTPVEILAAAPAGKMYVIHKFMFELVFVATAQLNGGTTGLQYGATATLGGTAASATFANTVIQSAASTGITVEGALAATARTSLVATSITISNDTAAFDTGDSTAIYSVWYSIVTV